MEKILLEAGTNEMEMLVFMVGESKYGINVAKIREIIRGVRVTKVPLSHEAVEGSFQLREEVLTLVNLAKYLEVPCKEVTNENRLVIVVELSDLRVGVSVDEVERIYRRKWSDIEPPPPVIMNAGTPVTGITHIDGEIILIIDFETIMLELMGKKVSEDALEVDSEPLAIDPGEVRILLADDSPIIRRGVEKLLRSHGFENLVVCNDGNKAWAAIEASMDGGEPKIDVVLSDIEMPGLDGLHLTTKIRKEERLKGIKVVLFSSIVNPKNDNKGNSVGADAQIAKNSDHMIIKTINDLLNER